MSMCSRSIKTGGKHLSQQKNGKSARLNEHSYYPCYHIQSKGMCDRRQDSESDKEPGLSHTISI